VTALTLDVVKTAILDAGFEVFRTKEDTIQLAERVRSHLMDAGIRVRVHDGVSTVLVTVRSQRSDFPAASQDDLFSIVRAGVGSDASSRGFAEVDARPREIQDPVDASRVLDVWYEVTFGKPIASTSALLDDVQWALRLPKCVDR
jgi:hypothetical protein